MKMLTINQPWASAIMSGNKRIENRMWKPDSPMLATAKKLVGQRIGIHAGARWYEGMGPPRGALASGGMIHGWTYRHDESTPLGAILGTVRLDAVLHRSDHKMWDVIPSEYEWIKRHQWTMFNSSVWLVLSDPQPFAKPIPAKGMQGFWNWGEHK